MKIQIASDLHNEFGLIDLEFGKADLLVLAGDIDIKDKGVKWVQDKFTNTPVVYILGNHEYYKSSYPKLLTKIKDFCKDSNIYVLENESTIIDEITFHGATLWTNFELFGNPKIAGFEAQEKMNDYKRIRLDPSYSKLRSIDTHLMHYNSLKWLEDSLRKSKTDKNVVVTHHAPSPKSLPDQYKNDILSAAYASDLSELIDKYQPDIWIHGHIHSPSDYNIGNTRVICNPRGYPDEPYNGFNNKLIIEV